MARVIKAGGDAPRADKARSSRRSSARVGQSGRPVIEKVVFRAQQEAADKRVAAEEKRDRILAEGRQKAHQAREEAQVGGAAEAFAEAAKEAILAFRHRAERYGEAASDIEILALEVVKKVLGQTPALSNEQVQEVLHAGLTRLRARRRLRIQIPESRLEELKTERSVLISALEKEPDLLLEAQLDVNPGFARVFTEAGAALCAESDALDLLAEALEVDENAAATATPQPETAEVSVTSDAGPNTVSAPAETAISSDRPQKSKVRKSDSSARPLAPRQGRRAAKPLPPSQRPEKSARSAPAKNGNVRVRPLPATTASPNERVRRLSSSPSPEMQARARPLQTPPGSGGTEKTGDWQQEPKDVSFHDEDSYADSDLDLFADDALGE